MPTGARDVALGPALGDRDLNHGQEDSVVSLFVVNPETGAATRGRAGLGRASVNTIEVREGLAPGDQVILSDMSAWDAFDRVRLN